MKQRIITALILAPIVVLGVFLLPLQIFAIAIAGVSCLGFWEWTQFISPNRRKTNMIMPLIALLATFVFIPFDTQSLIQILPAHIALCVLGVIWWLAASLLALTYPKSQYLWENTELTRKIFGLFALIPFVWSVVLLRGENYLTDEFHGARLVLFVCLLVWAADTGAYFVGKSIGKRKMAPNVSPNKTIEGLLGGVVLSVIIGFACSALLDIHFESTLMMFVTIILTVVISVLGDLVESMFKRASGIKDSSQMIPGHGGVLDRIDSLMAAFPVFAVLYFFCQ